MTNEFLVEAIEREFPDAIVSTVDSFGMLTVEIKKDQIKKVIHHLKESTLQIDYLIDVCGVHYPEFPEKELAVVYHLQDMRTGYRVRFKAFSKKKNAEFDSLTDIYAGANWMERETFDFYGILFKGHPDLRVILNMEDIGYHPMLKEYPLEDGTRADKDDAMFGR